MRVHVRARTHTWFWGEWKEVFHQELRGKREKKSGAQKMTKIHDTHVWNF